MPRHKRRVNHREGDTSESSAQGHGRNTRDSVQGHRRQQRKETMKSNSRHAPQQGSGSRQSSEASSSSALEIPGFFFDPEKKRYFKIAPNHATGTCNYTKEAIVTKAAEEKRQIDVSDLLSNKTNPTIDCSHRENKCNLVHLLQNRTLQGYSKEIIRLKMLRSSIARLKPLNSQLVFDTPQFVYGYRENIEHMLTMRVGDNYNEILGLWSLKGSWVQRIQIIGLEESARTSKQESLSLSASLVLGPVYPQMHKVTDVCWAPIQKPGKHVLYTTMCLMGSQESLAIIKTFDTAGNSLFQDYNLGRKATWCCSWNPAKSQFCVGAEKSALVLNVERRTMWEYYTNKSDPLAVAFSHQAGNYLYTGTRRGEIMMFDQRCRSVLPTCTLQHKCSVCSIKLVHNESHLVGADFSGKIYLWDMRKRGTVLQYEGNVNQYSRLPVHIDDTESILYTDARSLPYDISDECLLLAVVAWYPVRVNINGLDIIGEDGYTRFWSFKDGRQLFTIPPPCPVSRETIPCVQLATRWGNKEGNSGLVMGLKNKLHYYGTLPLG